MDFKIIVTRTLKAGDREGGVTMTTHIIEFKTREAADEACDQLALCPCKFFDQSLTKLY